MPDGFAAGALRLFEPPRATAVVLAMLSLYTAGFLIFYPAGVTVADEGTYIRQAQLVLAGHTHVDLIDPFTGAAVEMRPISNYPLGTAILLLPFVALGGRDAAFLLPLLCTLVGVAATARWLQVAGRSPLWALLVLAYPATMVLGRVAMSEAPSLAVVALGLLLYWRGLSGGGAVWIASGFLAGFSLSLREANALLFAPLFLGSLVRRDTGWPSLVVGFALGLAMRLVSAWLFFGDPFFTKKPDPFSVASIAETAPIYLLSLLVLVPGGLFAGLAYRGARRPELVATVAVFVLLHLSYSYSAEASGWAKRLVLAPRYFIPLLPVLSFASAEVWPRLAERLRERASPAAVRRLEAGAGVALLASLTLLACLLVGVQRVHERWGAHQAVIRSAIYENTDEGSVIVTNWRATGKFIDLLYGDRVVLRRENLTPRDVERLVERSGAFYVVFLDRSDSEFWRRNAMENGLFLGRLRVERKPVLDLQATPSDRLRIWRVGR
jgi:hypothetical protein